MQLRVQLIPTIMDRLVPKMMEKKTMKLNLSYNFRIVPETLWLIGGTVLGTMLVDLSGRLLGLEGWPTLDTWQAWMAAITFNGFRTGIGALIAAFTGGFQMPGETKEEDAADDPTGPTD